MKKKKFRQSIERRKKMATTEMIRPGGPDGDAGGSSIGDGGMQASVEGGNEGRLGLDYAAGEQFEQSLGNQPPPDG